MPSALTILDSVPYSANRNPQSTMGTSNFFRDAILFFMKCLIARPDPGCCAGAKHFTKPSCVGLGLNDRHMKEPRELKEVYHFLPCPTRIMESSFIMRCSRRAVFWSLRLNNTGFRIGSGMTGKGKEQSLSIARSTSSGHAHSMLLRAGFWGSTISIAESGLRNVEF